MAGPAGFPAEVRDVMAALGLELTDLGQAGAMLQATLSPTGTQDCEGLQTLDLLTQRLFCLAEFLAALAPTIESGRRANIQPALEAICLSDTARRLSAYVNGSATGGPVAAIRPADTGLLDLF